MNARTALALVLSTFALAACSDGAADVIDPPADEARAEVGTADEDEKDGFEVEETADAPKSDDADAKPAKEEAAPETKEEIAPKPETKPAEPAPTGASCNADLEEVENNDSSGTAMKLPQKAGVCGRVASAGDVDFFTFTASAGTVRFDSENGSNISFRLTTGNSSQQLGVRGTAQFQRNTPTTYTVEVRGARAGLYLIDVDAQ